MTLAPRTDVKQLLQQPEVTEAVFIAHELSKAYRMGHIDVQALRSVNLELYNGELEVGQRTPRTAEIKSGVEADEELIVHPANEITDRSRVEVARAGGPHHSQTELRLDAIEKELK